MTLVLNGTTGVSAVDGSASTPAIQGNDSNTGIFFPAADTIAFAEGGAEVARFDSSGNFGIGTTAPAYNLDIAKNNNKTSIQVDSGNNGVIFETSGGTRYTVGSSIGVVAPGNYLAFNYYSGSAWSERMRIDSSGNVGVGTSSPTDTNGFGRVLDVQSSTGAALFVRDSDSPTTLHAYFGFLGSNSAAYVWNKANGPMLFATNDAERARIDSSGNLLVGATSGDGSKVYIASSGSAAFTAVNTGNVARFVNNTTGDTVRFFYASTQVGSVSITTTTTSYNTSSDYRLKHDIAPMTGALAKVAALKPVTYKWNADDSDGEGFIAHELAEVVPQCVTGEKDAVDENGNPQYQGIDTSFLVATLTAAIQELKAIVDQQAVEIAALKGQA